MNPLRRISSLQEDFNKLGIQTDSAPKTTVVTESAVAPTGEQLGEARLVRVKTKRMKGAAKAKARVAARKNKAKRKRAMAIKKKKASFKRRMAKIKQLKKGRKAGARKQFRLVAGVEQQATMFESLKGLDVTKSKNLKEDLIRGFMNVKNLATTLLRKFAVVEEVMDDLEAKAMADAEIEHPDSEHAPEVDDTNVSDQPKAGDADETAADAPAGNVAAEEDDSIEGWDDEDVVDSDDSSCDDDGEEIEDDGEEEVEESEDVAATDDEGEEDSEEGDEEVTEEDEVASDDEEETDDEEVAEEEGTPGAADTGDEEDEEGDEEGMGESLVLDMAQVRMEAEDVLDKLRTSVLAPEQAASVLQDMVAYLGGAMKVYLELASDLAKFAYAGVDQPGAAPALTPDSASKEYAGQGQPQNVGVSPEQTGDKNRVVGQDQPAGSDPAPKGDAAATEAPQA